MNSTNVRSSKEFQHIDLKTEHQDSSVSNGRQYDMLYGTAVWREWAVEYAICFLLIKLLPGYLQHFQHASTGYCPDNNDDDNANDDDNSNSNDNDDNTGNTITIVMIMILWVWFSWHSNIITIITNMAMVWIMILIQINYNDYENNDDGNENDKYQWSFAAHTHRFSPRNVKI